MRNSFCRGLRNRCSLYQTHLSATRGSGSTSGVRLTLDFRPGGINAWRPSEVISGTNDWQLYQVGPIVIETDRTAAVQLENYNGASGTAWFDDVSLVQILPPPVDVFLLYPNYRGLLFDDQPQTIQLDVTVTPPGGDFGRYTVRGVLSDETSGRVVAQRSFPAAAHLVAGLDATAMQSGRSYLAAVSLEDRTESEGSGLQTHDGAPGFGLHERGRGPGDRFSLPYFRVPDLAEIGLRLVHFVGIAERLQQKPFAARLQRDDIFLAAHRQLADAHFLRGPERVQQDNVRLLG